MLPSERVLGPRWSPKELRTFYILLKAHGRQWDKLEERLPQRTQAMVRALFDMHRGYLSLPEASLEGLCAIMTDHYEAQDELQQRHVSANHGQEDVDMDAIKREPPSDEPPARSRKKRRLEKLLATDQLASLQIQAEGDRHVKMEMGSKRLKRKSMRPSKPRVWGDEEMRELHGMRFELPSCHWFYSFVDVDFFRHNEFMECLRSMGLGKITAAARPIWSSVRASMGRPRRLSPLFFAQEKDKLEAYRAVKRRLDPTQVSVGRTWPYACPAPLHPGVSVVAWLELERRFRLATVASVNASEGSCGVRFGGTASRGEAATCSLDNVMVLDFPPWSGKSEASVAEPKLAATTLLRREIGARGVAPTLPTPKTDLAGDRYRGEKIRAVLAVKSLLHRKETIVSALADLNKRVAEQQKQVHESNAKKSSLWTTPTAFSSAAVKDLVWASSREKLELQKQHSWLAANLAATNSYLKAALLDLQSCPSSSQSWNGSQAPPGGAGSAYPSDSLPWGDDVMMEPTETLTEDQMRWAIDFLAASQQRASAVVAESALQVVKEDTALSSFSAPANEVRLGSVLPETMQLIANGVTLMSVLHRHVAASPDVPPVVTQTLVERVLELLKPSHEANMDLYAELRAAAESAQAQLILQAATREAE